MLRAPATRFHGDHGAHVGKPWSTARRTLAVLLRDNLAPAYLAAASLT
jgi:hypothetical protein